MPPVQFTNYTYKNLTYSYFYQQKFLLVLMRVSWFNQSNCGAFDAGYYRFPHEKTMHGLYIKVLIPLLDDE